MAQPQAEALSALMPGGEIVLLVAVLGACVGSFLNVVAWRLPREESVLWPASHCPHCGTVLPWFENIPVFAWLVLKGRCRHCAAPIHPRYPLIEALSAGLWVLVLFARPDVIGAAPPLVPQWLAGWALVSLLLLLALIDLDQLWIPEPICRWGLVAGVLVSAWIGWQQSPAQARELVKAHLLGAALGLIGFDSLSALAARWFGKPALGEGDGKVAALLGAWLGPVGMAMATLLAVSVAALVGVVGLIIGIFNRQQHIPFVPFLAVGGVVLWCTGASPWLQALLLPH